MKCGKAIMFKHNLDEELGYIIEKRIVLNDV